MRIVVISDTHGQHEELGRLQGDVLVHCGDFCHGYNTSPSKLKGIDQWFGKQCFELILCVGGNHDIPVLRQVRKRKGVFHNAVYLEDTVYEHRGVSFYGASWIPQEPERLRKKWEQIPEKTDVLITHIPPFGILDQSRSRRRNFGCLLLLERIRVVKPRLHLFGHNHSSTGKRDGHSTTFVNASVLDDGMNIGHPPFLLDIEPPQMNLKIVS